MSNDTEAPTSAATTKALENRDAGLTPDELQFVTIVCQHHGETGMVLDEKTAVDKWFYTASEFKELMASTVVQGALVERGVFEEEKSILHNPNPPVGKSKVDDASLERLKKSLTGKQLIVANVMLDITDGRSDKKKLQDMGVSTSTYNSWLNDKQFSNYLKARAELLIGNSQHEALLALLDKVKGGDTNAIKLYLEFTGRFTPQGNGTTVNVGVSGTKSDFTAVLITILEIIQEEVTDYDTAVRISDRFKAMLNTRSVAQDLLGINDEIQVPTVRASREMTPEINALMEHGEGY